MINAAMKTAIARVIAGYLLVLILVGAVGAYVVASMGHLQAITRDLHVHPFAVSNAAAGLRLELQQLRTRMLLLGLNQDPAKIAELAAEARRLDTRAEQHLDVVAQNFLGDGARVVETRRLLAEWRALRSRIFDLAERGQAEAAAGLITGEATTLYARIVGHTDYVSDFARTRAEAFAADAAREAATRSRNVLALLVLLATACLGLGLLVVRRVKLLLGRQAMLQDAADQSLRRGAERLRAVFESAVDGIVVIDRHGIIEEVNPAASRIFGYPVAELVGNNVSMLMPEPDSSRHDDYIAAYLASGQGKIVGSSGREVQGRRADGTVFPVHLTIGETRIGTEHHFVGIVRDISDMMLVQHKLERMHRFTRMTLDGLTSSVCVTDADGRIIYVNAAWRRSGRGDGATMADGGIGANYLDLCEQASGDGDGRELRLVGKALRKMLRGEIAEFSAEYPAHSPGQQRWMMLNATRFDAGDGPRLVLAHEDITELRGTQHELQRKLDVQRATLEAMDQGLLMVDSALNILTSNRKYFEMLHLPPAWNGRRMNLADVVRYQARRGDFGPGDPEEQVAERVNLLARLAPRNAELAFADGTTIDIRWNAMPNRRGAVATFTDISAQKRTEHDLAEARRAAEAANRAKSDFLATMSHEIRTPMNGIIGMAELLAAGALSPDQERMLGAIRTSAHALLQIINDILDFSRIEAGKLDIEAAPFVVEEVIESAASVLAPVASKKGVVLALTVEPAVPARLIGDALRLRQILINLGGNAIKFTGNGGRVEMAVRVEVPGGTAEGGAPWQLAFDVRDNGIGMAPEVVAKLFQPFTQADSATTRRFGGSGLGLSICGRLATLMKGTISVNSSPGAGSTFTLHLPLAPAAIPASAVAEPASEVRAHAENCLILVAEDNEINQDLIARQLDMLGHRADLAGNGHEALEMLAQRHYDLLLTDCHMPEMDGYELTRRLRRREADDPARPRLPTLACTANVTSDDIARCQAAGMDDIVGKPTQLAELRRALDRWLPAATAAPGEDKVVVAANPVDGDSLHVFNPTVLAAMLGDDPAVHRRILAKFVVAGRDGMADIAAARGREDPAALGALGHKLKSSSRSIGAASLADACEALERAGKAGDLAACHNHADAVARCFDAVASAVATHLEGTQS